MMPLINAHELVGSKRDVWWNQLKVNEPITLELVDYFKAIVYKRSRGHYTSYYAISRCEYPSIGILPGDELIIHISFRSYVNALRQLKSEYKIPCMKEIADGKNLLIKLERKNYNRILVHYQEIREPTDEQSLEAKKQYRLIKEEHEMYKK